MNKKSNAFLLFLMGICLIIWAISHIKFQGGKYGQCVKLPNGIYLGYEARISFGNWEWKWKPFVVPKFPNGTPVLDGEIWPFHATQTTIHGNFQGRNRKIQKTFLWQKDTGLIFWRDNPDKFDDILANSGPLLSKNFKGSIPTKFHYERLAKDPKYGLIDCKTRLFRW